MVAVPENKRTLRKGYPGSGLRIVFIQVEINIAPELAVEIAPSGITPILQGEDLLAVPVVIFAEPGVTKIAVAIMANFHFVSLVISIVVDVDDHAIDQTAALKADDISDIGLIGRDIGRATAVIDDLDDIAVFTFDQCVGTAIVIQIERETLSVGQCFSAGPPGFVEKRQSPVGRHCRLLHIPRKLCSLFRCCRSNCHRKQRDEQESIGHIGSPLFRKYCGSLRSMPSYDWLVLFGYVKNILSKSNPYQCDSASMFSGCGFLANTKSPTSICCAAAVVSAARAVPGSLIPLPVHAAVAVYSPLTACPGLSCVLLTTA